MSQTGKQIIFTLLSSTLLALICSSVVANDCKKSEDEKLHEVRILKQLKEGDIPEKTGALEEINSYQWNCPLSIEIVNELLNLAERKRKGTDYVRKGEFGLSYDFELIKALGNTRDPRSIPYLIDSLSSSAAKGLHKIGEPAIEPLLKRLHDESAGYRSGAARALGLFLRPNEGYMAKGEVRERIKEELIKEFRNPRNGDPDRNVEWYETKGAACASVRENIVTALGYLAETEDKDVIPIIVSVAEKDPYYLDMSKKKDYTGPQKRYPVREEASKILERLKEKEPTK